MEHECAKNDCAADACVLANELQPKPTIHAAPNRAKT
jgi:hypothetical protein